MHSNLGGSFSSFTKFKELPPELRIKIWQQAMPGPRIIIVESPFTKTWNQMSRSLEDSLSRASTKDILEATWRTRTKTPTLLHVSAESRHEALKRYQPSLGVGTAQPRIYIDFRRDTPFFGHAELRPECSKLWASTKDLENVRQLAIVPEGAWRVIQWQTVGLKALKKIIFVHGVDESSSGPQQQLVEDTQDDFLESAVDTVTQELQPLEAADTEAAVAAVESGWVERGQREESVRDIETSLESAMARHKLDPIKKRMLAAREELDVLMQVLPTQWYEEPAVSTAVFREGPGNS
ncbi:hypothetical protein SLS62_006811 [Diatrype stigma]|uniref:2EXR domain-containing protein n=1 Tax=Diatrype stigma TaxID=117547 RepID=A0AAN9YNU2_9PEZI